MKSTAVNFYRQLSFILIILVGLTYFTSLTFFSQKIYSGFLMQFIYLFDSLIVHPNSISTLFTRQDFLTQFSAGILWTYLLTLVVSGFYRLLSQVINTSKYLSSLNIIKTNALYKVFSSNYATVFTAGLLKPQVFVSDKVIQVSTPDELSSILNHEQSHRHNFDPLKNLFVDFISYITPYFPCKSWFFGQYYTLIEIGCDIHSQNSTTHPDSLITALIKIQESFRPKYYYLSHFSAQSERIKILVGKKKLFFGSILYPNLLMISLLIVSVAYLNQTDFFYQCQHLVKCFQNLVTPDHLMPPPIINNQNCDFPSLSS
ncbi:M48 family metalloprotease [Candidatus Shapirobacteria bacterium]|nr:M48 family metalloprotease [Candidatus Shapirobacteria bacterium]